VGGAVRMMSSIGWNRFLTLCLYGIPRMWSTFEGNVKIERKRFETILQRLTTMPFPAPFFPENLNKVDR
ncbi:MAG: hypothetical protein D3910_07515, partial [Candidatus Electrothrix sp. ATG2]|nr:hypothetical protein [Candidatus Electrothrix sp. ATG2]